MATSGTTSFNLDLSEIFEEAFERAGSELRTGYDFRTARRSLNIMFAEWANRGLNLWTVDTSSFALTPGTATYALPSDTVDLLEHIVRTGSAATQADLPVTRISVSTYASIPNKLVSARPIQVLITRGTDNPTVTFWPVPDAAQSYTFVYWRMRRIQDAGEGINTTDIPFRFIPPMIAGLSYHLATKLPKSADRVPGLKAQYDEAWSLAADEDREKASIRLVPRQAFVG